MATLQGTNLKQLKMYYEDTGTGLTHLHKNEDATEKLLELWGDTLDGLHQKPVTWIRSMLVRDRRLRVTAESLAIEMAATDESTSFIYSCNKLATLVATLTPYKATSAMSLLHSHIT